MASQRMWCQQNGPTLHALDETLNLFRKRFDKSANRRENIMLKKIVIM